MDRILEPRPGVRWRWSVRGSGPPLLLLHGFLGIPADWDDVIDSLKDLYTCYVPLLPGCGAEPQLLRSWAEPMSVERIAEELARCLTAAQEGRWALVGYSLGARIGLAALRQAPERFSRVILESANPGLDGETERAERAAWDDRVAARFETEPLEEMLRWWYGEVSVFASLSAQPELRAALVARRAAHMHPKWAAKLLRECSPGRMHSHWSALPELHAPTLLVSGENDPKYKALAERMVRVLPNARHECVTGAGHTVHLEQPDVFSRLCREFLEADDPSSQRPN